MVHWPIQSPSDPATVLLGMLAAGKLGDYELNSLTASYKVMHHAETAAHVAFLPNSTHLVSGTDD